MRRTPSPNRVNPADGTGVSSVYKPLPPKNSRDGIDLAKRKIRAYSKEREVITTPATTKNKIPDIRSRFPEQGCNGIVSVNKRNFIRRSAPNNTPVSHTAPRPLHAPYVKQGLSTSFTPMGEEPLNDVVRSSIQKGRERSVSRQPSVDTPQRKRSRSGSRVSPMTGRPPSKSRQPSIERPLIKGDRETTHSSKTDKTRKKSVDPVVMNHQASRSTPKQRGNSEARAPSSNRQVHMSSNRAGSSAAKPAVARNRSPSVAPRGSFLSDGHRSLADTVRIKTVTAATPSSSFNRRSRSVNNSVEDITSRSLKCSYKYGDYRRRVNDDKFGESLDDQRELAAMLKNHWKQIQERFLILEKIIRFMDSKIHEAKIIKSIEDEKRAKRRSEKENEQRRVREEKRREKQRRQEEHEKADREETQRNMEEEVRRQLKRPSRLSEAEKQRETGRKRRYGAAGANNMQQYAAATDMELSESKSHRSGTFNQQQQQHSSGIGSYHDPHDSGNQQQLYPNNLNQQLKRDPVLRAQTSATYRTWMVKRES